MTTIDHRILIPAPPDVVWDFVSDITRNPDWQVDCTEVIFLTSRREGPGLRWRYATPGGHEMVIAVTAWYNGLGYEYYFVDGTPFRENKGRIRLQEIPEGTIVQWTFTYELGGMLGGMRNSFGMKRQVDQTIAESLKTLWQKIKQTGGAARTLEPKSLIREAPDVEARSTYQPRHPSVVDMGEAQPTPRDAAPATPMKVEPPIWDDDAQPIYVFDEPPAVEDDTRPRSPFAPPVESKPVPAPAPEPKIEVDFEPDFLDELVEENEAPFDFDLPFDDEPDDFSADDDDDWLAESSADPSDTQPRTIEDILAAETASELTETVASIEPASDETELLPVDYTKNIPETAVSEQVTDEILETEVETVTDMATIPTPPADDSADTASTPATKDEGASIWEIFGVPRPSKTQEMSQAVIEAAASSTETAAEVVEEASEDATLAATSAVVLEDVVDDLAADEPEAVAEAAEEASEDVTLAATPAVVLEDVVVEVAATETEAEAINGASEAAPEIAAVVVESSSATRELPPIPVRVGLRITQRRKLIRLRRP